MKDFTRLDAPTTRMITKDQRDYLFFGGTAYLGLLAHEEYVDLYIQGLRKYGLNNGTSRSNNIQLGIFDEAEEKTAFRFGFDAAILVSSGYLAAQLVIQAVSAFGKMYYAPATHPALWLKGNPQVAGSFSDWMDVLIQEINQAKEQSFVIVSNSLDNMRPEQYDFSPLLQIHSDKKILLVIDDSHGIGVLRKHQVALDTAQFSGTHIELLFVASLAKGLGTDAGVILSTSTWIDKLRCSTFFTGASPASPAGLYALINADEIYAKQFDLLQRNIGNFAALITDTSITHLDHFPIFTSTDSTLYRYLEEQSFLISSFPYPLPSDPLLNRIVISSLHDDEDLKKIAESIRKKA